MGVENNTITTTGPVFFNSSGDPGVINGSLPTGGNGQYTYQWQISTTSETTGFTNIGVTLQSYDPNAIFETSFYRRLVTSAGVTSTSNTVSFTTLKNNQINFNPAGNKYYYSRPVTPPEIKGSLITGTTLTINYRWVESMDGKTWHIVYGSDGTLYRPSAINGITQYARDASIYDANGNNVFSGLSNVVIAYVFEPITENTICCDQTVYGLNAPVPITGSSPIGGNPPLYSPWEISTDGTTWTNAPEWQGDPSFKPISGRVGKVFFRRKILDASNPRYISYSNVVYVDYLNVIPIGAAITNPFPTSTFDINCQEYLQTVNSLNGKFNNSYGGAGNDVFYKVISNDPRSGHTILGFNTCSSDVNTKLYLFDSNFNPMTLQDKRSDCLFFQDLPTGTYYLMAEGNGTIKLQIGTYNYSDCPDVYYGFPVPLISETSISPNPADQSIQIRLSDSSNIESKKVYVYDKNSTLVRSIETKESELTMSVQDLLPDVYIVKIISNQGVHTQRLIIKK